MMNPAIITNLKEFVAKSFDMGYQEGRLYYSDFFPEFAPSMVELEAIREYRHNAQSSRISLHSWLKSALAPELQASLIDIRSAYYDDGYNRAMADYVSQYHPDDAELCKQLQASYQKTAKTAERRGLILFDHILRSTNEAMK